MLFWEKFVCIKQSKKQKNFICKIPKEHNETASSKKGGGEKKEQNKRRKAGVGVVATRPCAAYSCTEGAAMVEGVYARRVPHSEDP